MAPPPADIDTQRKNIQGQLAVVESSVAYQEVYARELCSHYRTHRDALATLERERKHEWPLFLDAIATGLDTVGTVVDEALVHFEAEHATASAYRVYRLRELDPDLPNPGGTSVPRGRDRSLLLSAGGREFVSTYFSVQEDGAVTFSLNGVPSILRQADGYQYESIGDFVVRLQSQPDFLDDAGPATRYLSAVSAFLQTAVTRACHRWLSHLDVFQGRFFDALQEDIDAEVRARFRRVHTAILEGVASEVACRPGSSALAARSLRAVDELYDEREASEQRRYAQEYGQRFDRMNWVGQRTMDAIWIERILLSEAPMEEVRALLAQYDQEYQEAEAVRTRAYLELERLREANAHELAVAQEESRRALAQAADEAQWHYKEELLKLEGIRLQVTTNAKLAVETRQLELDAERAMALRAEEEKWRRAIFEANTELEREQLRQRAETERAQLEANTARLKARIDREGNILSAAARAIDSIFGN